ncbi:Chymotrypsinogen B [Pseudolycoriella hygida]|uniref:Chymotrypsinogen B n=1 Tax=Pseudolycoriella hygida TaxID=35572 RepID=A0A9Q0S653_9DIPT|nr:Chymotrypsinogen B [Pseudolycoriella hygida]
MNFFLILIVCAVTCAQALPRQRVPTFEIHDGVLVRTGARNRGNNLRIVGGSDAVPHSAPHKVSLQWGSVRPSHFCAGLIIHTNWVLSAAHCISQYPAFGIRTVVAGLHDLRRFEGVEQIRQVTLSETWTHEDFDGFEGPHDIGLMLFRQPFVFNNFVNSVALPAPNTVPSGVGTMHGWGSTSAELFPIMPDILQTADLVIVPVGTCRTNWSFTGNITDNHVCAGNAAASACMLDDGGALVQNDVAVALLSWGNLPCGFNGRPAVFTRISVYISWINNIMDNN